MQRFVRSLLPTLLCGVLWVVALGRCAGGEEHPNAIQAPRTDASAVGSGGSSYHADGSAGAVGSADASAGGTETGTATGTGGTEADRDASGDAQPGDSSAPDAVVSCSDGGFIARETSCSDQVDNDCDGRIDCDDADCQPGGASSAITCDALGRVCSAIADAGASSCSTCPGGHDKETNCGDNSDDDCDGKTDCADSDCLTKQCGLAASQICQGTQCTDMDSGYSLHLAAERITIPADGIAISPLTITLSSPQGLSITNKTIQLFITGPGSWYGTGSADAGSTMSVLTSSTGVAHATFLSSALGGKAKITALLTGAQTGTTIEIDMPVVDSIALDKMSTLMGVAGSGYQEENLIRFTVYAPNNKPYPAGLLVTVTHESLGGSALGPPRALPVAVDSGMPMSTTTQTTNADGQITVTLYSGTVAGTRSVIASATAGGQTRTLIVPNIVIVGAKANGEHLSIICSPDNIPALVSTDCITMRNAVTTICTLTVADRYDHRLGVARSVVFASEAGNLDISEGTPEYPDPNQGVARTVLHAVGGKPPLDVPLDTAMEGEEWIASTGSCGTVRNPRDGVVTVIAALQGEEGFDDINRNGVFDPGEPFIDLPEPFVDMDDDNMHDDNEYFIDTNQNGKWDAENHQWDANTTIWAGTKIVFTSAASAAWTSLHRTASRYLGGLPDNRQLTTESKHSVSFGFADMNLNVLASTVGVETYSVASSDADVATFKLDPGLPTPAPTRTKGFDFHRLYCPEGLPPCYSRCTDGIRVAPIRCTIEAYVGEFEKMVEVEALLGAEAAGSYRVSASAEVANTTLTLIEEGMVVKLPP